MQAELKAQKENLEELLKAARAEVCPADGSVWSIELRGENVSQTLRSFGIYRVNDSGGRVQSMKLKTGNRGLSMWLRYYTLRVMGGFVFAYY